MIKPPIVQLLIQCRPDIVDRNMIRLGVEQGTHGPPGPG